MIYILLHFLRPWRILFILNKESQVPKNRHLKNAIFIIAISDNTFLNEPEQSFSAKQNSIHSNIVSNTFMHFIFPRRICRSILFLLFLVILVHFILSIFNYSLFILDTNIKYKYLKDGFKGKAKLIQ